MGKKWTRNQKIALWSIIIGATTMFVGKVEINLNRLQSDIKELKAKKAEIEDLKSKVAEIASLIAGKIDVTNLRSSGLIESGGFGQSQIRKGLIVNNEAGSTALHNFQVKGNTDNNMIFGNAIMNNVGIGTSTPKTKLDVIGKISVFDINTGVGTGVNLCIDKNNVICACGTCAE